MSHLDDAALDAIEQRADKAANAVTDGPWEWVEERKFVDHVLADIPALLAAVRDAQQRAQAAEAALQRVRKLTDEPDHRQHAGTITPDQLRRALDGGPQEAT